MKTLYFLTGGALLLAFSSAIHADNKTRAVSRISCQPDVAYLCTLQSCQKIDIIDIYASQNLVIDLKKNTLTGALGDTQININHIRREENETDAFVFSGTHHDSMISYNWIFRIDKTSKKMTISSISGETSHTIFGSCQWEM